MEQECCHRPTVMGEPIHGVVEKGEAIKGNNEETRQFTITESNEKDIVGGNRWPLIASIQKCLFSLCTRLLILYNLSEVIKP